MDDYRVQVKHHAGPADLAEITDLLGLVEAHDHHRPLSEHKWIDLARGGTTGFAALLAHEVVDAELVGYGQLSREPDGWGLEVVVHPAHRGGIEHLAAALLAAAVTEARRGGGGRVRYWAPMPTDEHQRLAASLGFAFDRELRQLRVPLPLAPAAVAGTPAISVRPFVVGADEGAWLAVNNRAFAGHPEQGGWDLATLQTRESQPWFDPAGFLLYEEHGRLAGSCWTKVHGPSLASPSLGEIFVIGVDPDFQHRGLGRSLTVAGLEHLAAAGTAVGMLYVDAANTTALSLYRSLGFTVDHVDRSYLLDAASS